MVPSASVIRLARPETRRLYQRILLLYRRKRPKEIAMILNMEKSLVYKYLKLALSPEVTSRD